MNFLGNKKILFIGIGFYDYETCIVRELEKTGANVFYICENHNNWIINKLKRFSVTRKLEVWYADRYLKSIIMDKTDFDEVFVIKGERLTATQIGYLRSRNPSATFRLYQWDSIERFNGDTSIFPLFDKVFTFDRLDSMNFGYKFRPLFFRISLVSKRQYKYDVSFVGWLHFDRLKIVEKLFVDLEASGCSTFFYIYTGFKSWFQLLVSGGGCGVHIKTLSYSNYCKVVEQSRAVLDLPHPRQNGLTMRAIETLGANRKIITTNPDIKNYDFFFEENVLVMDENVSMKDILEFLELEFRVVPDDIVKRYSLQSWIRDIFELNPRDSELDGCGTRLHEIGHPNGKNC